MFGAKSIVPRVSLLRTVRALSSQPSLNTYVLEYFYVPNILERRAPHRTKHLEYTVPFVESKTLIAGGALVPEKDPITRGQLLFRAVNAQAVEEFAKNDPYVVAGIITKWTVTEWKVVVGDDMFGKMWNK